MQSELKIHRIELGIHLGVSLEEQSIKQEVQISCGIRFPSAPKACQSDKLDESICYVKVASIIQDCALKKPYHLIEHLAHVIYQELKGLEANLEFCILVQKMYPPHPLLKNSTSFSYGDYQCIF